MNTRHIVSLIVLGAIWGSSFLFMRVAVKDVGAIPLIELRIAIGALVLWPVLLMKYPLSVTQGWWGKMTVVGVFNSALPFTLLAYGLLVFTAGVGSVLNATVPMFTALIAFVWLKESLSRSRILGLVVGFIGVIILVGDKLSMSGTDTGLALAAMLLATLSYGFSANYTKRNVIGVNSLVTTVMSLTMGALVLLPLALIYWPDHNPSLMSWISIMILGVICTGAAYLIFFRLIAEIGAARTVTVTFLVPLFGIVWGIIFLGEELTWQFVLGALVIIIGTALSTGVLKLQWLEPKAQA
ncbi:DMT family transporter [Thiofilum flexile]|uniref:DMT family transporter n=1 Tax=Thiofilum flexile TaxID=125627 RepID=UPI00036D3829|nr:DMT family transporter [Thiofilum flexile]